LEDSHPGRRIEALIRGAMAAHSTVHTVRELAGKTGMSHNTIYAWFKDPDDPLQKDPSTEKATAVCRALSIPVARFWDAWEGREPEPDSAEAELRLHRASMDRQTVAIERLLKVLQSGAVAAGVLRALEQEDAELPEPPTT
jgi:transcriptional regulator with XRE-family HTH domain